MNNVTCPAQVVHLPNVSTWAGLVLSVLMAVFTWQYFAQSTANQHQLKMEKSSGRNGKHINQKAKESAEQQFDKLKQEFDALNAKTSKTKTDNAQLNKLEKQIKHWRKKKDWKGENHSQKHKGN